MKRRFGKSTKRERDGTRTITSWKHSPNQDRLQRLYVNESGIPKLGPTNATGVLQIGEFEQRQTPSAPQERKWVNADFTLYNLADHLGFTLVRTVFTNKVIERKIGIPDEIVHDMSIGAKLECYKEVLRLREYYRLVGINSVKCYFYLCWRIMLLPNENTGVVEFVRSQDRYLCLVPMTYESAAKRWNIDEDLTIELAINAGFLAKSRIARQGYQVTKMRLLDQLGDWRQFLSTTLIESLLVAHEPERTESGYLLE